jgi:hypothetical protein
MRIDAKYCREWKKGTHLSFASLARKYPECHRPAGPAFLRGMILSEDRTVSPNGG